MGGEDVPAVFELAADSAETVAHAHKVARFVVGVGDQRLWRQLDGWRGVPGAGAGDEVDAREAFLRGVLPGRAAFPGDLRQGLETQCENPAGAVGDALRMRGVLGVVEADDVVVAVDDGAQGVALVACGKPAEEQVPGLVGGGKFEPACLQAL